MPLIVEQSWALSVKMFEYAPEYYYIASDQPSKLTAPQPGSRIDLSLDGYEGKPVISVPTVTDNSKKLYAKFEVGENTEMKKLTEGNLPKYSHYKIIMCSALEVKELYAPHFEWRSDGPESTGLFWNQKGLNEFIKSSWQGAPEIIHLRVLDSEVMKSLNTLGKGIVQVTFQEIQPDQPILFRSNSGASISEYYSETAQKKYEQTFKEGKNIPVLFVYKTPSQNAAKPQATKPK